MIDRVLIIVILISSLFSCNISSRYFIENTPSCSNYYEIENDEEVTFVKNKEFKEISKILKEQHMATVIRQIVYFKVKRSFYCEFYTTRDTIICLLLDKNKKVVSKEKVQFDY